MNVIIVAKFLKTPRKLTLRDPRTFGIPAINVAGYDALSEASELPLIRDDSTLHIADTLSIRDGRTTWKVGGDLRQVSAADVQHVAQTYLKPDRSVRVILRAQS